METVQNRIKALRELRGYTQDKMASLLSMSQSGYAKIERGNSILSHPRLEQIAKVLGGTLADLLGIENEEETQEENKTEDNVGDKEKMTDKEKIAALELELEKQKQTNKLTNSYLKDEVRILKRNLATCEKKLIDSEQKVKLLTKENEVFKK